jgi:hypothetical protein
MITRHAMRTVTIPSPQTTLFGNLAWPIGSGRTHGLAVVAHPSSGARLNPRHQALAAALNRGGLATLLTDLLGSDEDQWEASAVRTRHDVGLLTERMVTVLDRVARMETEVAALPVGVLATGTAAAAALHAAAVLAGPPRPEDGPAPPRPAHIDAIVCRSGRTDLAADVLDDLAVPVLFVVAEHDHELLELHRSAGIGLTGRPELRIVPGTADLVADGAAAGQVAALAAEWLAARLDPAPGKPTG